jgi:hypothetical protein
VQLASWRRVLKMPHLTTLLSGLTLEPSAANHGAAVWMESLAVSPAPISALPADRRESTETPADCSSSTCESFAKFSPDGSLLRMSLQCSLFQQEQPYSENLPRSGSMRNGELYERPMLAPRIDGTGLSSWHSGRSLPYQPQERPAYQVRLPGESSKRYWERMEKHERENGIDPTAGSTPWPTPDCNTSSYSNGKFGENLREKAANWPTPRSEDSESCGNHPGAVDSLTGATRQWATPDANTWKGGNPERVGRFGTKHGGANLADDVTLWRTPDVPNGGRTMSAEYVAANGATDKGKRQVGLKNQAKYSELAWSTPKARDSKSEEGEAGMMRQSPDLNVIACHFFRPAPQTPPPGSESSPNAPTSRRRLNPNFVDWLMALPPGWTAYAPVETASWYSRQRMHLRSLLGEQG